MAKVSAAASAIEAVELRSGMFLLPDDDAFACNSGQSPPSMRSGRAPPSFPRLIEISHVGGRLALLGRHQITVRADEIGLLADADMGVVLGANILGPDRPWIGVA